MHLTKKDKSLLLLIIVIIIIIWSLFSFSFKFFLSSKYNNKLTSKISNIDYDKWINIEEKIINSDLKNKIIILKFWHHSCVTCIQNITNLEKSIKEYKDKVIVIAIHSSRYNSEKKYQSVSKAVDKYKIKLPVIVDDNHYLKNFFKVDIFPKYIFIDPNGNIAKEYSSVINGDQIKSDINGLIKKFRHKISDKIINIKNKDDNIRNVLNYPSRLSYSRDFIHNNKKIPVIFISNIGDNNIIVSSLSGKIIQVIGNSQSGFIDGSFKEARFDKVQGMVFKGNKLYLADSGNNAIRVVDFNDKKVSTLVGNGVRGDRLYSLRSIKAKDFKLNNPLDLAFFGSSNNLVIANSGVNQIIEYNIKNKEIKLLAGSGDFDMVDGSDIKSSLAQTYDIEVYENKLYFLDSKSSSLRYLDLKGNVVTIIGDGLNKFGEENNKNHQDKNMQNPTSLTVDDTGIYIIDNLNNAIRHYNFNSKKIDNYKAMNIKAKSLEFIEPTSIIGISDKFYIADSNNHRIIQINRTNYNSSLFNIMPNQKIAKKTFDQLSFNNNIAINHEVTSDRIIEVDIKVKKGWKINDQGPSFLNFLQIIDSDNVKLLKLFDWRDIINNNIDLSSLQKNKNYILYGNIYYCQDKENSICFIKNYQSKISTSSTNKSNITIEL
ncbi:redoxin domain-containing protein [Rickettsiales bacterium]|nr:redoxin domain-containing protein [Rickettsiales bacterium]